VARQPPPQPLETVKEEDKKNHDGHNQVPNQRTTATTNGTNFTPNIHVDTTVGRNHVICESQRPL